MPMPERQLAPSQRQSVTVVGVEQQPVPIVDALPREHINDLLLLTLSSLFAVWLITTHWKRAVLLLATRRSLGENR